MNSILFFLIFSFIGSISSNPIELYQNPMLGKIKYHKNTRVNSIVKVFNLKEISLKVT
jgi:hypothetical protein